MEYLSPPKTHQILLALGGKVQNALIKIFDLPIWSREPCECRDAIDEQAKPLDLAYASSSPLAVAMTMVPACDANCTA
jgi:hypothetical protein